MSAKKNVLDVGCGESSETLRFFKELINGENLWVVGVDWSHIFCKQSKNMTRRHNLDAEYVRCNAAFLPFRDAVFHIVCMLDSLRCLKGHRPEEFVREAFRKLTSEGELYISGLDRVSFHERTLPAFRDPSLAFNWRVYVPRDESSPFMSKEPNHAEAAIKGRYRYVGTLPEQVVSELLWRCCCEPETTWKKDMEGNYSYHRYIIKVKKR